MANIGQFRVGTEWTKLDDVTGFTFVSDSAYTIQNKEYQALLVCEGENKPIENKQVGFILQTGQALGYTAKSGEYLWVRAYQGFAQFNIAEGI